MHKNTLKVASNQKQKLNFSKKKINLDRIAKSHKISIFMHQTSIKTYFEYNNVSRDVFPKTANFHRIPKSVKSQIKPSRLRRIQLNRADQRSRHLRRLLPSGRSNPPAPGIINQLSGLERPGQRNQTASHPEIESLLLMLQNADSSDVQYDNRTDDE